MSDLVAAAAAKLESPEQPGPAVGSRTGRRRRCPGGGSAGCLGRRCAHAFGKQRSRPPRITGRDAASPGSSTRHPGTGRLFPNR